MGPVAVLQAQRVHRHGPGYGCLMGIPKEISRGPMGPQWLPLRNGRAFLQNCRKGEEEREIFWWQWVVYHSRKKKASFFSWGRRHLLIPITWVLQLESWWLNLQWRMLASIVDPGFVRNSTKKMSSKKTLWENPVFVGRLTWRCFAYLAKKLKGWNRFVGEKMTVKLLGRRIKHRLMWWILWQSIK